MRFIQEMGFSVKPGMEEAHQQWLLKNEKRLGAAHPEGTTYLGTFATVMSTEKEAGSYRTFVELDSYAALDRLAAAAKDPKSKFGKLIREWSAFDDTDPAARWSNGLFKAVVDATVWDPPA